MEVVVAGCHSSEPGSEAPDRRRKRNEKLTDREDSGNPSYLSTAWLTGFWSMEGFLSLASGGRVTHQHAIEPGHGLSCLALNVTAEVKYGGRQAGRQAKIRAAAMRLLHA